MPRAVLDVFAVVSLVSALGLGAFWANWVRGARAKGHRVRTAGWVVSCMVVLAVVLVVVTAARELGGVRVTDGERITRIVAISFLVALFVVPWRPRWITTPRGDVIDVMRRGFDHTHLARSGSANAIALSREAMRDYEMASKMAPDSAAALYGWAVAMIDLARFVGQGSEADELLESAEDKLTRAAKIGSPHAEEVLHQIHSWKVAGP